jgi:hypothetical protein
VAFSVIVFTVGQSSGCVPVLLLATRSESWVGQPPPPQPVLFFASSELVGHPPQPVLDLTRFELLLGHPPQSVLDRTRFELLLGHPPQPVLDLTRFELLLGHPPQPVLDLARFEWLLEQPSVLMRATLSSSNSITCTVPSTVAVLVMLLWLSTCSAMTL